MNPADTVTVTLRKRTSREKTAEVKGRLVVPGLAITPTVDSENRYSLTHIPSGLAFIQGKCSKHVEQAAEMVHSSSIDWTAPSDVLVAYPGVRDLAQDIANKVGWCERRCDNTYDGPSWQVRCNTCGWEADDEDDGPLDVEEAKRMARYHECEPDVQISLPDGNNKWYVEWLVNDDGTIGGAR